MAEHDTTITVGADIGKLSEAMTQAKEKIASLSESAEGVNERFKTLLELAGIALSLEGIKEFIKSMGELGEATERTSAILGISTVQVGEYNYIARMAGGSTQGMAMSMEILATNLQRAKTGQGQSAEALKAMGLNAKDLIGLPLPEVIGKIADKFSSWADGMNKTALARALMGRAGAEMIPELDKGSAALKEMADEARRSGAVLTEHMTENLVKLQHSIVTVETSFTSLGAAIANKFSSGLIASAKWIAELNSDIAIAINTGFVWERVVLNLKYLWDATTQSIITTGYALNKLMTMDFEGLTKTWEKGLAEAHLIDEKYLSELGKLILKQQMQWKQMLSPEHGEHKIPAPDFGKADVSGQAAALEGQIKLLEGYTRQYSAVLDSQVQKFQITENTKFQLLIDRTNKDFDAEMDLAQRKRDLYERGTKDWETANAKMKEMEQKHVTDMIKLNEQSVKSMEANFMEVGNAITSSFNSQLRGLLAGTTTWAQAMKNIEGDLIIKLIEIIEEWIVKWIAAQAATLFASQDANAAMVVQANLQNAALLPSTLSRIEQRAAEVFAGASAFFAPTLGPGAPAAALGVSTSMQAAAAGMAMAGAAEQGAWEIPNTAPWLLHKGEMVLPAPAAQAVRDTAERGGGGNSSISINISAIDGASVQRIAPQLAKYIAAAMNKNPTLRPAY